MDFFNQINMLYGTITEFCTADSCPVMSAGPKYVVIVNVHRSLDRQAYIIVEHCDIGFVQ